MSAPHYAEHGSHILVDDASLSLPTYDQAVVWSGLANSFPDPSLTNPVVSSITESSLVANILSRPILILERVMGPKRQGRNKKHIRYLIKDECGNILGHLEEESRRGLFRALSSAVPSNRSFTVNMVAHEPHCLLQFNRNHSIPNPDTKIFLPKERGTGFKQIGVCKQPFQSSLDRYRVFDSWKLPEQGRIRDKQFGSTVWEKASQSYLVLDNSKRVAGQISKVNGTYTLKMEPRSLDLILATRHLISRQILSLEQRAVILGMIVNADYCTGEDVPNLPTTTHRMAIVTQLTSQGLY